MKLDHKHPVPKPFLAIVAVLYLGLAAGGVMTNMPWCDEAWFASPAMNLAAKGYMGTSVLDPTATFHFRDLRGIGRFTYWIVPLYPVVQAGWQLVAGPSLFSVRFFSVWWGLVALAAWYALLRKLTGDPWAAFLAAVLLAIDFQFVWSASVARMDMMCAALGVSGLAAYVWLRERNFACSILASHACVAASGLSHPLGLGYLAALVTLTIYFDRSRVRLRHIAIAAVPYLAGAAGWGWYIAKDPSMFLAQFLSNASNRVVNGQVLLWLRMELLDRYLEQYGFARDSVGLSHIKIVALAVYAIGLAGAFLSRGMRQDRGHRALLYLWAALFVVISAIDKEVQYFYIVHFMMPLAAILAVWTVWAWRNRAQPRWLLVLLLAALALTQSAVLFSRYRSNLYAHQYLAATDFLKSHPVPGGVIMGSAELAFQLGFDAVVDGYRLGYRSGKKPSIVVLDRNRYQEWIPAEKERNPAAYSYITALLESRFRLAYENHAYRIYLPAR